MSENLPATNKPISGTPKLQNLLMEYFGNGDPVPIQLFDRIYPDQKNFADGVERAYGRLCQLYAEVTGQTPDGELHQGPVLAQDDKLRAYLEAAEIVQKARIPNAALRGAAFTTEIIGFLDDIGNKKPVSDTGAPPEWLEEWPPAFSKTTTFLLSLHARQHPKITPLMPSGLGVMLNAQRSLSPRTTECLGGHLLFRMLGKLTQEQFDTAVLKTPHKVMELPEYRKNISLKECNQNAQAKIRAMREQPQAEFNPDENFNFLANYRTVLVQTIGLYAALRKINITPEKAIQTIIENAAILGQLTQRASSTQPEGFELTHRHFEPLLAVSKQFKVEIQNDRPKIISTGHPPLPPDQITISGNADHGTRQKYQRMMLYGGHCPVRHTIRGVNPEQAARVRIFEERVMHGYHGNPPAEVEILNGGDRGGDDARIDPAALGIVVTAIAGCQHGIFDQLEKELSK